MTYNSHHRLHDDVFKCHWAIPELGALFSHSWRRNQRKLHFLKFGITRLEIVSGKLIFKKNVTNIGNSYEKLVVYNVFWNLHKLSKNFGVPRFSLLLLLLISNQLFGNFHWNVWLKKLGLLCLLVWDVYLNSEKAHFFWLQLLELDHIYLQSHSFNPANIHFLLDNILL